MQIKRENEEKREELTKKYGTYHSPGDGWLPLTEHFMERVGQIVENHNQEVEDKDEKIQWPDKDKWIDIKEKFGGLRISSGPWHEDIASEIFMLESFIDTLSQSMCESCGRTVNVTHTPMSSWRKTVCKDCIGEEAYNELEGEDSG